MLMIPVLMILKVPGNTTSGSTSSKDSTAPAMNRGGTEGAEKYISMSVCRLGLLGRPA